jgi:hypothetical protein
MIRSLMRRQYAPLKHLFISMILHGAISQMAVIFILTTVRTCNIDEKLEYLQYTIIQTPPLHLTLSYLNKLCITKLFPQHPL